MVDIARQSAYESLLRIERSGAWSNLLIGNMKKMDPLDHAFATTIILGVVERKNTLDWVIRQYAQRLPDAQCLTLIRMGVYQILYMDRVPDSAACNESVILAGQLGLTSKKPFVNAVLRSVCREKDRLMTEISRSPFPIRFSMNEELVQLLSVQYPDDIEKLLASFFEKHPVFLRTNTLRTNPESVATQFEGEVHGSTVKLSDHFSEATQGLKSGMYYIQGWGSQEAVRLLGAQPEEVIADVCACPGGKSLGAAIDMSNRGIVLSFDIHENKLSLIQQSAQRLGISIIHTAVRDARTPLPEWEGKLDRVICDVPCSGLGVISSKPEIRYKHPDQFSALPEIQKSILECSSTLLKRGGVLVYSTCTINKQENEEVVHCFLDHHSDYSLCEEHTWLPYEEAGEGFYAAKLVKGL